MALRQPTTRFIPNPVAAFGEPVRDLLFPKRSNCLPGLKRSTHLGKSRFLVASLCRNHNKNLTRRSPQVFEQLRFRQFLLLPVG